MDDFPAMREEKKERKVDKIPSCPSDRKSTQQLIISIISISLGTFLKTIWRFVVSGHQLLSRLLLVLLLRWRNCPQRFGQSACLHFLNNDLGTYTHSIDDMTHCSFRIKTCPAIRSALRRQLARPPCRSPSTFSISPHLPGSHHIRLKLPLNMENDSNLSLFSTFYSSRWFSLVIYSFEPGSMTTFHFSLDSRLRAILRSFTRATRRRPNKVSYRSERHSQRWYTRYSRVWKSTGMYQHTG